MNTVIFPQAKNRLHSNGNVPFLLTKVQRFYGINTSHLQKVSASKLSALRYESCLTTSLLTVMIDTGSETNVMNQEEMENRQCFCFWVMGDFNLIFRDDGLAQ